MKDEASPEGSLNISNVDTTVADISGVGHSVAALKEDFVDISARAKCSGRNDAGEKRRSQPVPEPEGGPKKARGADDSFHWNAGYVPTPEELAEWDLPDMVYGNVKGADGSRISGVAPFHELCSISFWKGAFFCPFCKHRNGRWPEKGIQRYGSFLQHLQTTKCCPRNLTLFYQKQYHSNRDWFAQQDSTADAPGWAEQKGHIGAKARPSTCSPTGSGEIRIPQPPPPPKRKEVIQNAAPTRSSHTTAEGPGDESDSSMSAADQRVFFKLQLETSVLTRRRPFSGILLMQKPKVGQDYRPEDHAVLQFFPGLSVMDLYAHGYRTYEMLRDAPEISYRRLSMKNEHIFQSSDSSRFLFCFRASVDFTVDTHELEGGGIRFLHEHCCVSHKQAKQTETRTVNSSHLLSKKVFFLQDMAENLLSRGGLILHQIRKDAWNNYCSLLLALVGSCLVSGVSFRFCFKGWPSARTVFTFVAIAATSNILRDCHGGCAGIHPTPYANHAADSTKCFLCIYNKECSLSSDISLADYFVDDRFGLFDSASGSGPFFGCWVSSGKGFVGGAVDMTNADIGRLLQRVKSIRSNFAPAQIRLIIVSDHKLALRTQKQENLDTLGQMFDAATKRLGILPLKQDNLMGDRNLDPNPNPNPRLKAPSGKGKGDKPPAVAKPLPKPATQLLLDPAAWDLPIKEIAEIRPDQPSVALISDSQLAAQLYSKCRAAAVSILLIARYDLKLHGCKPAMSIIPFIERQQGRVDRKVDLQVWIHCITAKPAFPKIKRDVVQITANGKHAAVMRCHFEPEMFQGISVDKLVSADKATRVNNVVAALGDTSRDIIDVWRPSWDKQLRKFSCFIRAPSGKVKDFLISSTPTSPIVDVPIDMQKDVSIIWLKKGGSALSVPEVQTFLRGKKHLGAFCKNNVWAIRVEKGSEEQIRKDLGQDSTPSYLISGAPLEFIDADMKEFCSKLGWGVQVDVRSRRFRNGRPTWIVRSHDPPPTESTYLFTDHQRFRISINSTRKLQPRPAPAAMQASDFQYLSFESQAKATKPPVSSGETYLEVAQSPKGKAKGVGNRDNSRFSHLDPSKDRSRTPRVPVDRTQ